MAPLVGRLVRIDGLNSRPELNGRTGQAVSFNEASGRYNVQLQRPHEELLALRPVNVVAAGTGASSDASGASSEKRTGGGLPAVRPFRGWGDLRYASGGLALLLVLGFGFSLLNAMLLSGVAYLVFNASRREGGLSAAAHRLSSGSATLVQRLTGSTLTPLQAGFLAVSILCLTWYYWIGSSASSVSAHESARGRSFFDPPSSTPTGSQRRRASEPEYGRHGYGGGYDGDGGGFFGSGWDIGFMLSAAMLGMYAYNLGGGGSPGGWSASQLFHRVRNMDLWQLMMLTNLVTQVLGGRRRGGGMPMGGFGRGGFGRRGFM